MITEINTAVEPSGRVDALGSEHLASELTELGCALAMRRQRSRQPWAAPARGRRRPEAGVIPTLACAGSGLVRRR